jgi:2-methylcitrate dehydratase PrpD
MTATAGSKNPEDRHQEVQEATRNLARYVHDLKWSSLPPATQSRATDVLLDTLGVMLAGARTAELRSLQRTVAGTAGPARPIGTQLRVDAELAVWLDGIAACCLEMDEGHKAARGHPAAHVVPTLLALAATTQASGNEFMAALVGGHEVATRMSAATVLHPGVHPHGTAGVAGAAAAAARLMGLGSEGIAAAIDAAVASPIATTFVTALDGAFVRNTWIGQANSTGIAAARLSSAGLAAVHGRAADSLGAVLGRFEPDELVRDLGDRSSVETGYFKRHASCAYTHAPADAAIELCDQGVVAGDVAAVTIDIHRLGLSLDRREVPTRLAAMFSLPYVVAATLVRGRFDVDASGESARLDQEIRRLVDVTTIRHEPAFDEELTRRRPARVTVELRDGARLSAVVQNPVGDVDHRPFTRRDIEDKLIGLLGPTDTAALGSLVEQLPQSEPAATVLDQLPDR